MNKLVIPNGGMPLFGDDFAFLDNANRDAIKGLLFDFSRPYNGNLLIGGCDLTNSGGNITISPGYILINYEVCYFAGITYASGLGATGTFALDSYFDPAGLKVFANSTSNNTYQVRVATFAPGPIADGPLDYSTMPRLSRSIYDLMQSYQSFSQTFTMLNGWQKDTGNDPVLYRHFKWVNWVGNLLPGTLTNVSMTKITVLPAQYRPVKRVRVPVATQGVVPFVGWIVLEVFPNGDVFAVNPTNDVWDIINLNVSFQTV